MIKTYLTIVILLLLQTTVFAQKHKSTTIGKINEEELEMQFYDKDTLANALVLYEHANIYIDEENDYKFRTDHYYRIKIFDKEAYSLANINIPFYDKETVKDVKAVTYNLNGDSIDKTWLKEDAVFTTKETEYWSQTKFTLPNLKEGCVIEYVYSVISPYSRLDDWYFQSETPKLNSEYNASILGNYKYNIRLVGTKELDKKDFSSTEDCIHVPGMSSGSCINYTFGMRDIPAFKEEDYMLSKKNYMSRLILDQLSYTDVYGAVKKYTKTWEDADKTLKRLFLDNQTSKQNFFKKNLPEEILNVEDDLERAKQIYKYIQNKLFWNGNYWTQGNLKVKNTFDEGTGSVDAINLVLHNSLNAAGIKNFLVASSTRNNGLPTKLYPIIKDFNYITVKAVIDDKSYFLDATDKKLAFGQIPFKCLNGEGRVLDFDNGGYWEPIKTKSSSILSIQSELELNDVSELEGELRITRSGYYALDERKELDSMSDDEYLDDFETKNPNLLVNEYEAKNETELEKPLEQKFSITLDHSYTNSSTIRINPFFFNKISKNPFKLDERTFDVDYGYPRTLYYTVKINIPDTYSITKLPEKKAIALPNSGGNFMLSISESDNSIMVTTRLYILKKTFSAAEYAYLKEFYNQIIKAQQSYIQLEKN
ncbi:MAG: DUF3857 domain-containing protein [Winogradskyella sp.]|nr:DUF3857 domain-containing protein [Winogradskyella sp.]